MILFYKISHKSVENRMEPELEPEPELDLEPEPQFVISATATGGTLIYVPRLSGSATLLF
jgi:hypothetical protein